MKYTKDILMKLLEDNQITTTKTFREKLPAAYLWYNRHKNQIGELGLTNIKRPNNSITKNMVIEAAKLFQYRSDFQISNKGMYLKAFREKWLDEVCAHMVAKPYKPATHWKGRPAHNRKDITGKRFGKWTIVSLHPTTDTACMWNCICDCGAGAIVSSQSLREGNSTKCTNCSNQVSQPTKDIAQYLTELGITVSLSDRSFGFELDIVVHSHKFIIEYDGLIWHSSKFRATEALEKARRERIRETGYTCFRIFEDEWLNKKDIVLGMLKHRLVGTDLPVQTEYELRVIETPAAYRKFFEDNHLDGYGRATFAVGAFVEDKLISCMSFRPYIQGKYVKQAELARFVSDKNINSYGLFGKLLKYALPVIEQKWKSTHVVSASDNRISQGKVYANSGFKLELGTDDYLNYYYYCHGRGLRVHRAVCRKLKPPQISKEQYMQYPTERSQVDSGLMAEIKFGKREPLYKIWGWGSKLWVRPLKTLKHSVSPISGL